MGSNLGNETTSHPGGQPCFQCYSHPSHHRHQTPQLIHMFRGDTFPSTGGWCFHYNSFAGARLRLPVCPVPHHLVETASLPPTRHCCTHATPMSLHTPDWLILRLSMLGAEFSYAVRNLTYLHCQNSLGKSDLWILICLKVSDLSQRWCFFF